MKNKRKICKNSVSGVWDWRDTSIPWEEDWCSLKSFYPSEHIWDFDREGIMTSVSDGIPCYCVCYKFNPSTMILLLNGYELGRDGERHAVVCEQYRVVFPAPGEMYLYDMEDFMGMPECRLRLHFLRA